MIPAVQSRVELSSDEETSDCDFDRGSAICHKEELGQIKITENDRLHDIF
jgi:hypothetical protein